MTDYEREQIIKLRTQGVGYREIASTLDLTRDTVRSFCRRNNLNGHGQVAKLNYQMMQEEKLLCQNCGKLIKAKDRGRPRKYCSDFCRRAWWRENQDKRKPNDAAVYKYTCKHCGKEFKVYGNKNRKYCSHDCYIKYKYWSEEGTGGN